MQQCYRKTRPKTAHFLITQSKIVKIKVYKVKFATSEGILYHCKGTWNRIIQPKDFIAAPPPPEGATSSWVRGFEFMAHPCRKLACGVWRAVSVRQKQELYISSWSTEARVTWILLNHSISDSDDLQSKSLFFS